MSRRVACSLAAVALLALASCDSSGPQQPAPATPSPTLTPATAAFIGRPKTVTTSDGASASANLNGVRYQHIPGEKDEVAVVDVTLTGRTARPFQYSDAAFVFAYADDDNPYAHTQDGNLFGPSASEDYTPYSPPAPLRSGQLTRGQSKRGLVVLRISPKSQYDLILTPIDTAQNLAIWALTSK